MTEKEVQEIYERLLELTKAGAVQWKKTDENEFAANFSRSSVGIGRSATPNNPLTFMWIYNEDGLLVARIAPVARGESEGVREFMLDPSELFNLVQDKVYKYSETTENILDELRKLKAS
jgi:hypothetical protein